ncbi:MAG: DUF3631 domain-containing protein, partial [Limisphaerales bacterium]
TAAPIAPVPLQHTEPITTPHDLPTQFADEPSATENPKSTIENPEDAAANAVTFPALEPWPEPITNGPALFDEAHDRALHYLYLPGGAAVVLTLWSTHASAIGAFQYSPRLNFTSTEPGCGKSTALSFLATLTPKVLRTDNLKPAVLFRIVDRHQPTLLLDELDSYLHLYSEIRGLLNAGISRDGFAHRCEGNIVRAFKAFAATALAGLGPLTPTLRSRSITIPLSLAPPGAIKARFDRRHLKSETILARKIARWTQDNFAALSAADPPMPGGAYNRLADNWRPLFAVAQVIGGHWPDRALDAFQKLTKLSQPPTDPQPSTLNPQLLLSDLRQIFATAGTDRLFSSHLVRALQSLPSRPWSGLQNGDKPITEHRLARWLKALGISSQLIRKDGLRARGYLLSSLQGPAPAPPSEPQPLDFQI